MKLKEIISCEEVNDNQAFSGRIYIIKETGVDVRIYNERKVRSGGFPAVNLS